MDNYIYEANNYLYKVIAVPSLFIGLNSKAVEYLIEEGDWLLLIDFGDFRELSGIDSEFAVFMISSKPKDVVTEFGGKAPDPKSFMVSGFVWEDKILPSFVYDWSYFDKTITRPSIGYPLHKYKLKKNSWIYEKVTPLKSKLYDDIKLLCLSDEYENLYFEWTPEEIELADMLVEYQRGIK